jgi:hypothetical protein
VGLDPRMNPTILGTGTQCLVPSLGFCTESHYYNLLYVLDKTLSFLRYIQKRNTWFHIYFDKWSNVIEYCLKIIHWGSEY